MRTWKGLAGIGLALSLLWMPSGRASGEKAASDVLKSREAPRESLPPGAVLRLGAWRLMHPSASCLAFSHSGKILASGGPWETRLWDVASGNLLGKLKGHGGSIHSIAFAPDDKTLLSADGNDVRAWELG